ncbi:MAG: hypothetical protein GOU97_01390 [Nanoarchaeota archaeon]|nr:hypothetical protein [Nanoarchaeota archaeon]
MVKHDKLRPLQKLRKVSDHYLLKIPFPKINPNKVSGLSIITSILFIISLNYSNALASLILFVSLLLDWFDGLIAKKHGLTSEKGYIVDVTADRFSEAIIFIPFFFPWFYLFALNMILTLTSFVKKKHVILPLRQVFLIYFIIAYL